MRAVWRMVVCVDAAAELSTISSNRWVMKLPKPDVAEDEPPSTERTSLSWARFSSPIPGPDTGVGLGR